MRAWHVLMLAVGVARFCEGMPAIPPSTSAPGNLTQGQLPMFILFTHDDGVDKEARKAMLSVTEGRVTASGCPVTATMFTLIDSEGWTSCEEVVRLYEAGYEIADHTTRHESLPGRDTDYLRRETAGARTKIAECGIPESDIVGFRSPYLNTDSSVRGALHEAGFLYESSLVEDPRQSLSRGFGSRIWPWDLGFGVPINCSIADLVQDGVVQGCDPQERWPGLYEVPVWRYSNEAGYAADVPYAMDPGWDYGCNCMNDSHSTFDILKSEFDAAYRGNRAPFPIFIHFYWLDAADNLEQLRKFVDYTLALPDVYYITIRQLLGWMADPLPKDQLTPEALGCGSPGGAPRDTIAEQRRRQLLMRLGGA